MKKVKHFCFILCALALICTLVPQAQARKDDRSERYGYSLLQNDQQREAYEELADGIGDCDKSITFTVKGITADDVSTAIHMVTEDHPEYFWFSGNASIELWDNGEVVVYPEEYTVDGKKVDANSIKKYSEALENAAEKALKGMPTTNDREKAHYLHDYIASNVAYEFSEDDQTAYGALVEGKAVCAGYARAYQYLLQKAGIKAWYVTGNGLNPTTGTSERHGWNLVFIDGKCYYTDVTWDDQVSDTYHAYFLLSLEEMSQTHVADDPEYLPGKCSHKDMDYFAVHSGKNSGVGTLKSGYTAADIAGFMKEVKKDTWECHVEDLSGGDANTFYSWLEKNKTEIARALGMYGSFTCSFSSLWDEYQITFVGSTDHVHARPLFKVSAVESTCTQGGHEAYYTCNTCGQWFSDSNAANPISDQSSINTAPKGHSYTVVKNTANEHWKECAACGAEESGSRTAHADGNKDNKCDVCSAKVQSSSQTKPTTDPMESTTQEPTEKPSESDQEPGTEPPVDITEQPTDTPVTDSTQAPAEKPTQESTQVPSTEETGSTEEAASMTQETVSTGGKDQNTADENDLQNDDTQENSPVIPIVIASSAAVAGGGGATAAIIRVRRKRR